ncbi:MAG: hypothetical protein AB1894_18700 [Chloroflexota bacterium]
MIALFGALNSELHGMFKSIAVEQRTPWHTWRIVEGVYAGRQVLLVRTGMGKDPALHAAGHILKHYPARMVISLGFAGSIDPRLQAGDLLLCRRLFCDSPVTADKGYASDGKLLARAARALKGTALTLLTGDTLTVDRLVAQPAEKQQLRSAYGVQAVDMESYWLAETAARRGLPFLAVRAISDGLDESLPPFDRFTGEDGQVLLRQALRHFISTSSDLFKLPRLGLHAWRAQRSLTACLQTLIPALDGEN